MTLMNNIDAEECTAYLIMAITIPSFSYLLLWLFAVPFIPDDSVLRSLFPQQIYAILIPMATFWLITIIGVYNAFWIKRAIKDSL
ncbi:dolichol phosphate-mannose biosynthesis regulatory protein (DPM2) domain-containing protein [Ditylenchus destructor]|uniref:Dolichol phosphate-mannose biosynthesis regulatory protein n=1 Tax=Ditylenchus destructor TaxID=166010 RepID=A0AAD4N8W2_9BILA|nr:dolichol phosphate-mannose biosynthesis regulatory protein (DPM2) domain-containing protein [Ditylenchus destructor]